MEKLTEDVFLYNRLRNTLKRPAQCRRFIELEKSILQRCHVLIYRVPMETKLLDRELCAEFLLSSMPYTLTIVRNFRNQGISFEAYLRKIIRTRARTFYSEKRLLFHRERTLLYCCGRESNGIVIPTLNPCSNRIENTSMEGVDIFSPQGEERERWKLYSRYRAMRRPLRPRRTASVQAKAQPASSDLAAEASAPYGPSADRGVEKEVSEETDARRLFKKLYARPLDIEETAPHPSAMSGDVRRGPSAKERSESLLREENPAAARLQQEMGDPEQRKRLLILLLSAPEQATPALINHLSSIMDIDELDLARLVKIANEAIFQKQTRQDEMQRIVNVHWKRRIWLDQQLYALKSTSHYDLAQCHKLEKERKRARQLLHERREERARSPQGLSYMQLGQLLGMPKGTVCSGIFYARKMLQECLAQEPWDGEPGHIAGE